MTKGNWIVVFVGDTDDGDRMYWSNETGWGNLASATRFFHQETAIFDLPLEGAWLPEGRAAA